MPGTASAALRRIGAGLVVSAVAAGFLMAAPGGPVARAAPSVARVAKAPAAKAPVAKPPAAKAPVAKAPAAKAPAATTTVPVPAAPPAAPSDAQIANAAAVKAQAARDVGRLSGLIAAVETRITGLQDASELAKEGYLKALYKLSLSQSQAQAAQRAVETATKNVTAARTQFRLSVSADYMTRDSAAGSMLTAPDPNAMLERSQLNRYVETKQTGGIADLNRATVAKSNADATARVAVRTRTKASTAANVAARAAVQAAANAKAQRVVLLGQQSSYAAQLEIAGERLTGLKDKRAAYIAWQQEEAKRRAIEAARRAAELRRQLVAQERERQRQEALARQRAADQLAAEQRAAAAKAAQRAADQRAAAAQAAQRAADQRAADQRAADQRAADQRAADQRAADQRVAGAQAAQRAADQRAADEQAAAAQAAQRDADQQAADQQAAAQAAQREADRLARAAPRSPSSNSGGSNSGGSNSGGSNSGGSNSGGGSNAALGGNGSWTPGRGRAAAQRALGELGVRYSFAAGNYNGPTWGLCVTSDAGWNDCHVHGFDCSGLMLYAWAGEGIYMPHYSQVQYDEGSVHPGVDELLPGDLVFFSSNGRQSGIHHVAMYIGNGNVVQAPQSGDVVKISALWMDGYFGATRPGT